MLTIFAIPKAFEGHIGIIQRNAIGSWTRLRPSPEIILVGDDEGTGETAQNFGIQHIPGIAQNEFGAPLVDSIIQRVDQTAQHSLLCYVNADIILTSDFMRALEQATRRSDPFVMVGQRWELDITEPLDFGPTWETDLRSAVVRRGRLGPRTGEDYCVYPKGFFADIPPFAVGHAGDDGWRLYKTRTSGLDLIDATQSVLAIHQNHDYSHIAKERGTMRSGVLAARNFALAGGRSHMFIIKDRNLVLTSKGLKRAFDAWRIWRLLRKATVLYPSLPRPILWALNGVNRTIDAARQLLVRLGLMQPYGDPLSD